jgi:hypothetical protein
MTDQDNFLDAVSGVGEVVLSSSVPPQEEGQRRVYQTPTLTAVSNLFEVVGRIAGSRDATKGFRT